jgi:hypothetical protein
MRYAILFNGQLTTDNGPSNGVGGYEHLGRRVRMYVEG